MGNLAAAFGNNRISSTRLLISLSLMESSNMTKIPEKAAIICYSDGNYWKTRYLQESVRIALLSSSLNSRIYCFFKTVYLSH